MANTLFYPIESTNINVPLPGTGSGFGDPRTGHEHGGVDLNAALGTPIYAAFGGVVQIHYDPQGGGYGVYVYAADGSYARYWHMFEKGTTLAQARARLASLGIIEGVTVAAGQVIGTVGDSGNPAAGAYHLHFSIYDSNGEATDPAGFTYTLNPEEANLDLYWTDAGAGGGAITQLALGDQGAAVRALQSRLASLGYDPGPIDGVFGPQTAAAVQRFQQASGLFGDDLNGVVDTTTAAQLGIDLSAYNYGGPEDLSPATPPAYSGIGADGVMAGGSLVRVSRPGQDDLYLMVYETPTGSGNYIGYQFDSVDQVRQTFGQGWETRVPWSNRSWDWLTNNVDVVDDALQVIGVPGNWSSYLNEVTVDLSTWGDPTQLGQMLLDPEIRAIAVAAAQGNWDQLQINAALRNTDYWQDVLYPGISSLYGMTTNPEQEWVRYEQSVHSDLVMLGLPKDEDGSYRSIIGQMLGAGIDDAEFLEAAPVWQRAATNENYFRIMQQWVKRETDMELTFDNWFDIIDGTAPAELMDIANRAAVQYQAENVGFDIGANMIEQIAENSILSEREIAAGFNTVEAQLLAMGNQGLKKYGLRRQDLIAAATGIKAPSGRSHEWIRQRARQTAIELSLLDDDKAQLFVGYRADTGVPQRQGMTSFSPEGA